MSLIQIFFGDTKTLALSFSNEDGTSLNVSGWGIFLAASQTYQGAPPIYVGTTGTNAAAVTGLVNLPLGTGDSSHCPGQYQADIRAIDLTGNVSTYQTEGLLILPTTFTS